MSNVVFGLTVRFNRYTEDYSGAGEFGLQSPAESLPSPVRPPLRHIDQYINPEIPNLSKRYTIAILTCVGTMARHLGIYPRADSFSNISVLFRFYDFVRDAVQHVHGQTEISHRIRRECARAVFVALIIITYYGVGVENHGSLLRAFRATVGEGRRYERRSAYTPRSNNWPRIATESKTSRPITWYIYKTNNRPADNGDNRKRTIIVRHRLSSFVL